MDIENVGSVNGFGDKPWVEKDQLTESAAEGDGDVTSKMATSAPVACDHDLREEGGTPEEEYEDLPALVDRRDVDKAADPTDLPEEEEWMDILGSGQLRKKVLEAGTSKSRPAQGSLVKVKVIGCLDNGSCVLDNVETFILGDGDVISAIDLSVALMDVREKAEVRSVSRFAYGAKGREPEVPADSSLTLTLELLEVQPNPDLEGKLSAEDCLCFGAIKFLDNSLGRLSGETSILQNILESKIKCYNNMAASQLKVGAVDAAVRSCEEVLKSQPENIKALYRQGKALSIKGSTDKAIVLLKKALQLDPESKLLHRELASLSQRQKKEVESERSMYRRMMGSLADAATTSPQAETARRGVSRWAVATGAVLAIAASVGVAYFRSTH